MSLISVACSIGKHKVCPVDVTDEDRQPAGKCGCPCHQPPAKTKKL